jgi:hypothetical protein
LLEYRPLFQEQLASATDAWKPDDDLTYPRLVGVDDYFEDETGKEIRLSEIIRVVTGNPNLIVIPPGMRAHDVKLYYLTDNTPLPPNALDQIRLSQEEVDALAYFLHDSTELKAERFFSNPPSLHAQGSHQWLESIPVENIRSFVVVFRRMYMDGEPGNYVKTCNVYVRNFLNKRLTDWVSEEKQLYEQFLATSASMFPGMEPLWSFSTKRLIDVFLYTRFVHQPKEDRIKHFTRCLQEVGNPDRMEFAFYNAMRQVASYYVRLHWIVSNELPCYLNHTGARPSFDGPPLVNEGGRGSSLTKEEREAQQLYERARTLGYELWTVAGMKDGELPGYVEKATLLLQDRQGRSKEPRTG